ncbi:MULTISPECIES: hypothetical protein [unclassified Variovorax]|uniref:hypothetical protein n=1 Tax=unclassified Variovorax TaxID=663243 RepID=UPI000A9892DD|nr:hypothetical protein [Variovorax sp. Root434]
MARRYPITDITIRIPFGTTEPGRTALLQATGIPLEAGLADTERMSAAHGS